MFDGYYFVSEVPYVLCYSVMPRVKRVESLFEMSVDFITENMDKFCKEMSTLGEMDAVSLERSPNVFNLLREFFFSFSLQFMYLLFVDFYQLSSFLFC